MNPVKFEVEVVNCHEKKPGFYKISGVIFDQSSNPIDIVVFGASKPLSRGDICYVEVSFKMNEYGYSTGRFFLCEQ